MASVALGVVFALLGLLFYGVWTLPSKMLANYTHDLLPLPFPEYMTLIQMGVFSSLGIVYPYIRYTEGDELNIMIFPRTPEEYLVFLYLLLAGAMKLVASTMVIKCVATCGVLISMIIIQGESLIFGTIVTYVLDPRSNVLTLFIGTGIIMIALLVSARTNGSSTEQVRVVEIEQESSEAELSTQVRRISGYNSPLVVSSYNTPLGGEVRSRGGEPDRRGVSHYVAEGSAARYDVIETEQVAAGGVGFGGAEVGPKGVVLSRANGGSTRGGGGQEAGEEGGKIGGAGRNRKEIKMLLTTKRVNATNLMPGCVHTPSLCGESVLSVVSLQVVSPRGSVKSVPNIKNKGKIPLDTRSLRSNLRFSHQRKLSTKPSTEPGSSAILQLTNNSSTPGSFAANTTPGGGYPLRIFLLSSPTEATPPMTWSSTATPNRSNTSSAGASFTSILQSKTGTPSLMQTPVQSGQKTPSRQNTSRMSSGRLLGICGQTPSQQSRQDHGLPESCLASDISNNDDSDEHETTERSQSHITEIQILKQMSILPEDSPKYYEPRPRSKVPHNRNRDGNMGAKNRGDGGGPRSHRIGTGVDIEPTVSKQEQGSRRDSIKTAESGTSPQRTNSLDSLPSSSVFPFDDLPALIQAEKRYLAAAPGNAGEKITRSSGDNAAGNVGVTAPNSGRGFWDADGRAPTQHIVNNIYVGQPQGKQSGKPVRPPRVVNSSNWVTVMLSRCNEDRDTATSASSSTNKTNNTMKSTRTNVLDRVAAELAAAEKADGEILASEIEKTVAIDNKGGAVVGPGAEEAKKAEKENVNQRV